MAVHFPIRTCIVCRRKESKAMLLRLAIRDQVVVEDPDQVIPGRGAYVCRHLDCISKLRHDKRIQRAYRGKAQALASDIGSKLHLTDGIRNDSIGR